MYYQLSIINEIYTFVLGHPYKLLIHFTLDYLLINSKREKELGRSFEVMT
jgi:hypothetical protein